MGEASMYYCIFLILLFYIHICILYVDILSNKSIYQFGIISLAHAPVNVTDFSIGSINNLCATLFASVNINYRLPIKVYYRICTLRHIRIEKKSWKPECVLSFNMDWQILVNFIPRFWLGIKY